jgi:hypothetical protein
MPTLEEDMLAQSVPQLQQPQQEQQQLQAPMSTGPANLRDALTPLAQDPVDDFMIALMGVADDLGIADTISQPDSIEDQVDLQDPNADPMEVLNEQQLIELVTKFDMIPEPQRSEIEQTLRAELPPQVASRLDAVIRFVRQRSQGGR